MLGCRYCFFMSGAEDLPKKNRADRKIRGQDFDTTPSKWLKVFTITLTCYSTWRTGSLEELRGERRKFVGAGRLERCRMLDRTDIFAEWQIHVAFSLS